jgi:hypothetical protein
LLDSFSRLYTRRCTERSIKGRKMNLQSRNRSVWYLARIRGQSGRLESQWGI